MMPDFVDAGATFSPDRVWRYDLWRTWDRSLPTCAFIGLNPSVADEVQLDATVRRCVGFARRWGCGKLVMLNAFAYVSGDPQRMLNAPYPVSQPSEPAMNDTTLLTATGMADIIIAAWSGLTTHRSRDVALRALLKDRALQVLGWTKDGYPRHPLYMRADAERLDFWQGGRGNGNA